MRCFRKRKVVDLRELAKDPWEQRFDSMMELIRDLPRADYNRLKDAMDLGYNAYQKVRNVKTTDEKDNEEILNAEKQLFKEVK